MRSKHIEYKTVNKAWLITGLVISHFLPLAQAAFQILKTDHGTHSLSVVDLDGDGRSEILVANRDQGSIDIFEQTSAESDHETSANNHINQLKPHLGYKKVNIPLNIDIYAMSVLDLNRDERPDLIYHGEPAGLQVQLQLPDGSFDTAIEFNAEKGLNNPWSLLCIPGEQGVEMVIQHEKFRSHHLLDSNDEEPLFLRLEKNYQIPKIEKDGFSWMHWGTWKDGSTGLWVHRTDETQPVSFYRALGECRYDPPIQWELPQTRILIPGHFKSQDHFDFIQVRTQQGQLFALEPKFLESKVDGEVRLEDKLNSRTIPFSHSQSQNFTCLSMDLNKDASEELIVAHRDSAEIESFEFKAGEMIHHPTSPTFRDIQWLGKGDQQQVIVFSATEDMTGISSVQDGELSFPKLQVSKDKNVGFISYKNKSLALQLDSDEQLFLTHQQQKHVLQLEEPWPEKGHAVHLTHKKTPDLVLQIPYQGLKIMTWDDQQKLYVDLLPQLPFLDNETLQELHLGAVQFTPGIDGQMDLTLSQGRLLRRYRFHHEPTIVSQINLPRVGSISSSHLMCTLLPGMDSTLVSLDRDRSELDFFTQKGDTFTWHSRHRCNIKGIDELIELKSPLGSSLICRGKGVAEWIYFGPEQQLTPLSQTLFQKEESWQHFERGEPLRLENGLDVALIYDSEKSTYNFYQYEKDEFKRIMSFPILERKSFRDKDEAIGNLRHVLAAPMEKNGKHAIVSLIDDRILVYQR
jgi:hypothetical protein